MADNVPFQTTVATPASGTIVAAREASAGGDTAQIQLVTLAAVTGSEGSYTVREVFYADDAAFTPGTGGVLAVGMLFDDDTPDSVNEGDIGIGRMSANRNAYVTIRDAAGNERGLNVDASGNITVNVTGTVTVGSHAVTNAGTFAVQESGSALTALQLIDDVIYVDDADWSDGTSKHALVGGLYQSTPQTVTDGDVAPFNITANGALHVAVQGTVTVASHAVTNAGTFAVQESGGALTALQIMDDWDESDRAKVNLIAGQAGITAGAGAVAANTPRVTHASDDPVTTALQLIDNQIVAHDAAVSGATGSSMVGFNARSTDPTAVASADATYGLASLLGKQVTLPYAIPGSTWSYAAASGGITDTTAVTVKAAAGAGIRNYVTSLDVENGHATVSTEVAIRDGAGGTVLWRGFAQAAGGGVSRKFEPPLRGTANTLLEVVNITNGAATYFNLSGYVSAE